MIPQPVEHAHAHCCSSTPRRTVELSLRDTADVVVSGPRREVSFSVLSIACCSFLFASMVEHSEASGIITPPHLNVRVENLSAASNRCPR